MALLEIVEPKTGHRIGTVQELENEGGYVWNAFNRTGHAHQAIDGCVKAARKELGSNIQFYNPETFELEH